MLPTIEEIESAANDVYSGMAPTPQYRWPMLDERLGTEVWVKHENHTPVGAFKIRGGLVYFADLARSSDRPSGVIGATKGNHGQSIGFAARRHNIPATIVVPHGNSREKNAAMRALGVELIEHGDDFQASLQHAALLAGERSLHMIPSFHPRLVAGVATCGFELLSAVPHVEMVYVPIGLGSGICGMIAARNALGLKCKIVGVVSAHANCYAQSFREKRPIESPAETRLADGLACSATDPEALETIMRSVDRIVEVTDDEIAAAMRLMFECTHNVCEGAGAAAIAATTQERDLISGRPIAVVLTGANVDSDVFGNVLLGRSD